MIFILRLILFYVILHVVRLKRVHEMNSSRKCVVLLALFKWLKGSQCFTFLRRRLPANTTRDLDRLSRARCKVITEKTRILFYKDCISNGIYPRNFYKILRRNKLRSTPSNLNNLCLSFIDACQVKLTQLIETQNRFIPILDNLSLLCRIKYINYCHVIVNRTRTTQYEKLQRSLSTSDLPNYLPADVKKYVTNLSTLNLNQIQLEALSLGLAYKIPPRSIDRNKAAAEFESFFDQLTGLQSSSQENENWFKVKLIDICNRICASPIYARSALTKEHINALNELKKNDNIVILKPDKGSGAVIMDKVDYISKLNLILSDTSKFIPDNQPDNVLLVEKQITRELHFLLFDNYLSKNDFLSLKPIGCHTPELYGLPKTHKPNVPIRPILSMCGSPYHQLAKWLVELLKPVRQALSEHCLKNTYELLPFLDKTDISQQVMCSFDVQSLFTNVPLIETVDFLTDFLDSHPGLVHLPSHIVKHLILLCTKDVKFYFQGKGFKQIDGVAMGSPLGPTLADIFMSKIELNLKQHIDGLPLYKRYLDDILIFAKDERHVQQLLSVFNSAHPNISFTCELEHNNQLPFLDVLLIRNSDGTMSRAVYRKPTWTGLYLNFTSFCPLQYKRTLVRTLYHRATQICTPDRITEELDLLKTVLKANSYPEQFIMKHLTIKPKGDKITTVPKKTVFLQVPYTGETVFTSVKRSINAALSRTFPAAQLRLMTRTRNIPLPPIKTPKSVLSTSHCIYQFTCSCGETYIGRTDRRLETRAKEHIPKRLLKRPVLNQPINLKAKSSIARHLIESGHTGDMTSFKVLAVNVRSRELQFLEAIMINRHRPALCAQKDLKVTLRLPWFY